MNYFAKYNEMAEEHQRILYLHYSKLNYIINLITKLIIKEIEDFIEASFKNLKKLSLLKNLIIMIN